MMGIAKAERANRNPGYTKLIVFKNTQGKRHLEVILLRF